MAQHHLGGQDQRARVDTVLAGEAGRRAVGRLENGDRIGDVGAGGDPDAADLGGQRVGDVVAVEVQRGDDVVILGTQQDLLQEVVGNDVLDDDLGARLDPPLVQSVAGAGDTGLRTRGPTVDRGGAESDGRAGRPRAIAVRLRAHGPRRRHQRRPIPGRSRRFRR